MDKHQLATRIWASANEMRSKIEPNEYKDYILGMIFYKFLSDNEVSYLRRNGWTDDDLTLLVENPADADAQEYMQYCQNNIGYFIEYKNLFSTWLLPNSDFSVATLSWALQSFNRLINNDYKHVYEGIFKTLQEGLSKLGDNSASQTKALNKLIKLIKDIPTDGQQDYDVLGYVYEFLLSHFAASAGKKAGEFYTPHEVAIVMSEIVANHHSNKQEIEIYDPTSGSGSLLITIGKSISRHIANKNSVKYYAQELMVNTYNLTRMNLVMRGIHPDNIITRCADSLDQDWPIHVAGSDIGQPLYVDAVVSNPPYSQKWDPTDADNDARFSGYGVAPKTKADYAFLLHELHHLKPDGILTIVLPHGVLFRGGSEAEIRKNLIEKNNIDAIIGLPAGIFFGTGIPTLIMVLKQKRTDDDVLIIDASKGFVKDGKQNRLRACDIRRIVDTVRHRATIDKYSRCVSRDEIRRNEYNLNIPRYVDSSDSPEHYDIYATMFGGIPVSEIDQLAPYWEALPSLRGEIFKESFADTDEPYAMIDGDFACYIDDNAEVQTLKDKFSKTAHNVADIMRTTLLTDVQNVNELNALDTITTQMFAKIEGLPLVNSYDAYQALANNWQQIATDIEIIQTEGFDATRVVEPATKLVKKDNEMVEVADGIRGRILPFELVQRHHLNDKLQQITDWQSRLEAIDGELDELASQFDADEQEKYLNDDNTALNKKPIQADAKSKGDAIEAETKAKLQAIVALYTEQSALTKNIKTAKIELESATQRTLEALTDDEVMALLDAKWIEPVIDEIKASFDSTITLLVARIRQIEAKYATPYHELDAELATAEASLAQLIGNLTGDDLAIRGLANLIKQ